MFTLDSTIKNDSIFLKDLGLSELRLMKDGDLDWFVLIPQVESATEWCDLSREQIAVLNDEIVMLSNLLREHENYDKINVANLGNVVSQLHIHVLGRTKSDRAWPGPIWGSQAVNEFNEDRAQKWKGRLL